MKIHEKDSAGSIPSSPTLSPPKRRRPSATKRKLNPDEDREKTEEPANKKVSVDPPSHPVLPTPQDGALKLSYK